MSSAKASNATRRLRSGIGIAPKTEGLSEAVLQRPSKHRIKIIADKAEPCVVQLCLLYLYFSSPTMEISELMGTYNFLKCRLNAV